MKQIGIWLDFREANVIHLQQGDTVVEHIPSLIERHNVGGGARSKSPWGPMDKVSESKYLARRKQQEKRYYEDILKAVQEVEELYIMGPAEAKIGLQQFLERQTSFKGRLLAVETVDSITPRQRIAKVKTFFANRSGTSV